MSCKTRPGRTGAGLSSLLARLALRAGKLTPAGTLVAVGRSRGTAELVPAGAALPDRGAGRRVGHVEHGHEKPEHGLSPP